MTMKLTAAALTAALVLVLAGCGGKSAAPESAVPPAAEETASASAAAPAQMQKSASNGELTVLLDWTPNTNHTGLYVADKLGYYKNAGLQVTIVDGSGESVAPLVAAGRAQFGVDFQDSLAPAFTSGVPVTAVAAILQHNTSGILSRKGSGIDRPKGMEGKTYATWDLPVEKATLAYVLEKDGGDFSKVKLIPNTVTDVMTALQTDIDAVWVYYGWDGVAADVKGLETDYFAFRDIDPVFDYYTPVLIANNAFLEQNSLDAIAFLDATRKGYLYAAENPDEAAAILLEAAPELDADIVRESQRWLAEQYAAEGETWGTIDPARWNAFYSWLWDNRLIEKEIPAGFGFDGGYLDPSVQDAQDAER